MIIYDKAESSQYMQRCVRFMLETQHRKFKRLFEKTDKQLTAKGNPLIEDRQRSQVYVLTTERESIERIQTLLERAFEQEEDIQRDYTLLVLDYYPDSRITPKYIQRRMEMGSKTIRINRVIGLEYSERDAIAQLEAAYEERIDLKAHSRQWIQVVMQLSHVLKQSQPELAVGEVGIDADSYLVRS